ncbi:adenosine kinase [Microbaculum marinum]|uniref:Adenosine kinase n=1 Tax=Microbaculum marinum TaxID=1764581 RepID=A0AAW9RXH5_9HYPH
MADAKFDVVGIGNAIVDVIARAEDDFLVREGLAKGSMNLIDEARADTLYSEMGPATEMSGGSCGNTIAGLASFGGRGAYFGKVAEDGLGKAFGHDIRALGVHFQTPALTEGPSTARCLVMVTPDGERTMNTFLGACQMLGPEDVEADVVANSSILYMEGYLWDPPQAKKAFVHAAGIAREHGREVALSLSDSFCVDRYRAEFLDLIRSGTVTLLFGNESELHSLYETADTEAAMAALQADCRFAVVTRSEKGAVVLKDGERIAVPAAPVERIVDLTGAGDLFAAGFLFGLARGRDPETCARLGGLAAAEVISHIGARPQVSLKELAQQNGLPV